MNELTASQKAALKRDRNISVTAGAGTGKTRILIERYIDILLTEDIDIKSILAITFTNKAAAEMMDRAATIIDDRLKITQDLALRHNLSNYRNRLSSAYISTIHSFCAKILREYPVEAGLDPDFKQLNELHSEMLVEETISQELEQINNEEDTWLDLFRLFGLNTIKEMLRFALVHRYESNAICSYYHQDSLDQIYTILKKSFLHIVKNDFNQSILIKITDLVDRILQSELQHTMRYEKAASIVNLLKKFQGQQSKYVEYWKHLFKLARIFTTQKDTAYNNLGQIGSEEAWEKNIREHLLSLSEILTHIAQWQTVNSLTPPAEIDRYVISQMKIFYDLYERVEKRYSDKKREEVVVDYDDLQMITLRLLQHNKSICKKIASQFKYIMVDEFQDTNLVQWEIISCLGALHDGKFFVVGDPKQSIYGFRNADVRVFNDVKNKFTSLDSSGNIILEDNFRFKDSVNQFVNFLFDKILYQENGNPWEVGYHSLAVKREDSAGGEIEFAIIDDHINERAGQAGFIANRIKELRKQTQFKYGDMAILLRTRNHLNEIEEQLRRNNVPFKTVGGTGFFQKQEIFDLYHLIRFVVHPEDDIALIGILRSPLANISDEGLFFLSTMDDKANYWQRVLDCENLKNLPENDLRNLQYFRTNAERWIRRRERIGFTELLHEILYDSFYRSILSASLNGLQLLANIDKIIELCREFQKNNMSSLTEFAESLRRLINKETREGEAQTDLEDESTVKVMTIHKAKGLEFPLVFLPYLEQKLNTPNSRSVYMDEQYGLSAVLQDNRIPIEISEAESYALLDLSRYNQKRKDLAELKRLFYVGCTRAKDHLILSAKCRGNNIPPDTPLSWLMQALEIKTEKLKEGRWNYKVDNDIQIWRSYDSYDDEATQVRSIQNSVKILKKLASKDTIKKKKPLFLLPTKDHPKGEIFSATQILTFIKDKEEYFRRYNLGFFEGDYDRLLVSNSEEEKALLKGKLLHKYFETYPNFNLENSLFELEVSDEFLMAVLEKELNGITRIMKESYVLKRIFSASEHKNEARIMMRLGSDFLTGTLDRIFKNEDGQWEVIDYKTNRISSKQVEKTALKYKIQMEIYALLLSHLYPSQDIIPVNLYFTQPDQIFQYIYSRNELKQIGQRIVHTIEEIKKFPPYLN